MGHSSDSSSSSDSDSEILGASSMKKKIYRLFGREKPVHKLLGGGKTADIFLWRNKKVSGGAFVVATILWILFDFLEYNLLTLICHVLMLCLVLCFLCCNASTFINRLPPRIPEVHIPEDSVRMFASVIVTEINHAAAVLRDIAVGKEHLKTFLSVVTGLWVISILGSCCNFLTLFYISFVFLMTVPVMYEKHEDKVDSYAHKALGVVKKQYGEFDSKVLSKIPKGLKNKKKA